VKKRENSLPYRQALPFLLKQKNWSYRDLDKLTKKSASYWNQTVTGKQTIPQKASVYEQLAQIFNVSPSFFKEYNQIKAAELVLKDPELAYLVIKQTKLQKK
jgi:transcriptional regulator with XRE-family HTH domain